MANGQTPSRTDPLSPYTATGSVGSRSSVIPPNPYKAQGVTAHYINGRWVPQGPAKSNYNWWDQARGIGSAALGSTGNLIGSVWDNDRRAQIGQDLGNYISGIPLLNDIVSNTPESLVVKPANFISAATGTAQMGRVAPKVREGDIKGALQDAAFGTATLVGTAASLGTGSALKAGTVLPDGTVVAGGLARQVNPSVINPITRLVEGGTGTRIGAGLTGLSTVNEYRDANKRYQESGGTGVSPAAQRGYDAYSKYGGLYNDTEEGWKKRADAARAMEYLRTPQYETTKYGSTIKQTFTDDMGRVHTWNPTSKMYEVTSTVMPDPRKWLSATEELNFASQLRDLERETADLISELQSGVSKEKSQATRDIEGINRSVSGGSQDLETQLAFLGMETSPGLLDVGQESLATAGATEAASRRRALADYISGVEGQIANARRNRIQGMADIESAKAAAIIDKINEQQKRDAELAALLYGGR